MKRWFAFVLALVVAFSATPATAATPADTLVMAWQFDDIITLDPAEIFRYGAGSSTRWGARPRSPYPSSKARS